jgi:hypothetical protein
MFYPLVADGNPRDISMTDFQMFITQVPFVLSAFQNMLQRAEIEGLNPMTSFCT